MLQVVRHRSAGGLDKITDATYSNVAANGHNQAIRIAINHHRGETCIARVAFESKWNKDRVADQTPREISNLKILHTAGSEAAGT